RSRPAPHSKTPLGSRRRRSGAGDGGEAAAEAAARADGVARARRDVESDCGALPDRRVPAPRGTTLAPAPARARWRAVRAPHGLPVEGRPAGVWGGLHGPSAIPTLGRWRVLRGHLEAPVAGL